MVIIPSLYDMGFSGFHLVKAEVHVRPNRKLCRFNSSNRSFIVSFLKKQKSGEPFGLPGCQQSNGRTQMGTTKRMRISPRMSQHIMQLQLTWRILIPPTILYPYWIDMFISQTAHFVNGKKKKFLPMFVLSETFAYGFKTRLLKAQTRSS